MSVRNIRNHHTRGLLPPPEVRRASATTTPEHVARLQLILDLQADGFNLAAIERLLSGSDGLAAASARPAQSGDHPVRARDPGDHHRRRTRQAIRRARGEGHRTRPQAQAARPARRRPLRSPQPDAAGRRRAGDGPRHLAARRALAGRSGQPKLRSVSRAFARLVLKELWEPFDKADQPDEQWQELIDAIDSLRPLASEALLALFKQRMASELEDTFGKMIEHQAKRK